MYKLYQIRLSKEIAKRVNAGEQVPEYKAHLDASCLGEFPGKQWYTHVADLDALDLDHCFEIGNIGPEKSITRHDLMHSISVGDVLVSPKGAAHIVKSIGFDAVEW